MSENQIGPMAIVCSHVVQYTVKNRDICLPMICPRDDGNQYKRLENVLEYKAYPVVRYPALAYSLCKWHTNGSGKDEDGVR